MPVTKGSIAEARQVLKKIRNGNQVSAAACKRAVLALGNMADRLQMKLNAIKDATGLFRD